VIKKAAYQQVGEDIDMGRPSDMKSMCASSLPDLIRPLSYVQSHVVNVIPT
jgi:hypothetical protein